MGFNLCIICLYINCPLCQKLMQIFETKLAPSYSSWNEGGLTHRAIIMTSVNNQNPAAKQYFWLPFSYSNHLFPPKVVLKWLSKSSRHQKISILHNVHDQMSRKGLFPLKWRRVQVWRCSQHKEMPDQAEKMVPQL